MNPSLIAKFLQVFCLIAVMASAGQAQDFPRVIQHVHGETVIDKPPKRIVSVGYHEQDFLYALGIAPVGVHEWFGNKPYATWVWADPARKALNAKPEVQYGFEIDLEWVYKQKPDLIIASFFNLDPSTYYILSRIAPVIAAPKGYPVWDASWQAELRLIAKATATEDRAEKIISDIDSKISKLAAQNPEFKKYYATVGYFATDHFVGYRTGARANLLLKNLGLKSPSIYDELVQENGQFSVSPERLDLFEIDTVIWLVDPDVAKHIQSMPIYQNMKLAREGRAIWADPNLTGALSFMTPLSIDYALDQLVPLLQEKLSTEKQ